jgi:endo-1,4-beta-xylanase
MDVPIGEMSGTHQEKLERQKTMTRDIFEACLAVPQCTGITLWGVIDRYSWLSDPRWGKLRGRLPHYPLAFDDHYQPKPMHAGILEAFASAPR